MSNFNTLEQVWLDIKRELKINDLGIGYCSIRGAARLVGVNVSVLSRHFQGVDFSTSKLAELLIAKGFNPVDFSKDGIPDIALAIIIKYYAYKAGARCTVQAELAYDAFEAIGIRTWIQEIIGWQVQPQSTLDTPHISRLKEKQRHLISNHLWAPFFESYPVYEYLERKLGFIFSRFDLIDGSVGKRWRSYREGKEWIQQEGSYIHNFDDQRGPHSCYAYQYSELPFFKDWLEQAYIPNEMPEYLVNKFGKLAVKEVYELNSIMNDHVAQLCSGKVTDKQQRLYTEFKEKQRFTMREYSSPSVFLSA